MTIGPDHYRLDGIAYDNTVGMALVALVCAVLLVALYVRLRPAMLRYVLWAVGGLLGIGAGFAAFLLQPGVYGRGGGVMQMNVLAPWAELAATVGFAALVAALCLVAVGSFRASTASRSTGHRSDTTSASWLLRRPSR